MDELRQQFGRRVKQLRRRSGLTQEQVAEAADISIDFLSLVERGINAPSFENLDKLAKALGVEVRELFDFKDV